MSDELFIRDVMSRPVTISKSAVITEALDKMLDEGIDPLIVLNNNTVVGTVSRMSMAEKLGTRRNSAISPNSIHVANTVEEDFTTVYPDQDIEILIPLLQAYKMVVVYDDDHRLIGKVTAQDLLRRYRPEVPLIEVMEKACTIDTEERVVHLRRRMIDDTILRFIVTEHEQVVGIVTETDVAVAMRNFREVVDDKHQDHRIRNLLVKDIMSSPVMSMDAGCSLDDVIDLMIAKNISTIPITAGDRLAGIITRESLIRAL
ncbi:MAG: CBS domain-containing protein [Methanomicrobiales archaeon]|nr:CBS domain-containing protein [Methanomicrobiales archaeon]